MRSPLPKNSLFAEGRQPLSIEITPQAYNLKLQFKKWYNNLEQLKAIEIGEKLCAKIWGAYLIRPEGRGIRLLIKQSIRGNCINGSSTNVERQMEKHQ